MSILIEFIFTSPRIYFAFVLLLFFNVDGREILCSPDVDGCSDPCCLQMDEHDDSCTLGVNGCGDSCTFEVDGCGDSCSFEVDDFCDSSTLEVDGCGIFLISFLASEVPTAFFQTFLGKHGVFTSETIVFSGRIASLRVAEINLGRVFNIRKLFPSDIMISSSLGSKLH